tara:strand:- start:599 stop:1678 length:1080 start_codon:yes stop_codon:yes gene_type:complete
LVEYNDIAKWRSEDLLKDQSWIFRIEKGAAKKMAETIKKTWTPESSLLDYSMDDFELGQGIETILLAAHKAHLGMGLTLVKGLPRDLLNEQEFELLIWAIGLHLGVARPQGKATQYISEVRNTGMNYRSAGGRGYNSNASLDFHTDGCDLVGLACYNTAKSGGQSIISSSVSAWDALQREYPELAEVARQDFCFSRNQEQAPDEAPFYAQPLYDFEDGNIFGKWNRNRVTTAQQLEGVTELTSSQQKCTDILDQILRRPEHMFTMWLEPGDLQFMNNHVMLHSRTEFEDYKDPEKKRLLYRLWIAPPNSVKLPKSWQNFFRSIEPGSVRGGIRGHNYDIRRQEFEIRQASRLGMTSPAE